MIDDKIRIAVLGDLHNHINLALTILRNNYFLFSLYFSREKERFAGLNNIFSSCFSNIIDSLAVNGLYLSKHVGPDICPGQISNILLSLMSNLGSDTILIIGLLTDLFSESIFIFLCVYDSIKSRAIANAHFSNNSAVRTGSGNFKTLIYLIASSPSKENSSNNFSTFFSIFEAFNFISTFETVSFSLITTL